MAKLTVVGMDPSFRNWGMTKGTYDTETGKFDLTDSLVVKTEKQQTKSGRNLLDIADAECLIKAVYPYTKGADVVCIECPVGSQNAEGMKAYAICVAIIACLKCAGLNIIITTPMQGKAVVTGLTDPKANAALNITKKEVIQWVADNHPEFPLPTYKRHGEQVINMGEAEHICDAVIALHAGLHNSPDSLN